MQLLWRFLIGGTVVSLFTVLGDGLRPKTFAGLFGAAPSIALATLGLTIASEGSNYAAIEARSMIVGSIAMMLYAYACFRLLFVRTLPAKAVTTAALSLWVALAICGWLVLQRIAA